MDWQLAVVIVIEVAAVAYLVSRFAARRAPRKRDARPDVPVSSLVRKR